MPELNPAYVGPREDILRLVPQGAARVLDVGCSVGALGEAVKLRDGATVVGLELDEAMAGIAATKLDRVVVCDVERHDIGAELGAMRFDCVICADILEHLTDPWRALTRLASFLEPDGVVIASIPNIRHYTTIRDLLFLGHWPHRERGIHDRTHLRFFTLRSIHELFLESGLEILRLKRNYRIFEAPHRLNRLAPAFALPGLREFVAFQYLVVGRRRCPT